MTCWLDNIQTAGCLRPRREITQLAKLIDYGFPPLVQRKNARVEPKIGLDGFLVRIIDPCEIGNQSRQRLRVETLDVATNAFRERGCHMHFDEVTDEPTRPFTSFPERAHRGDDSEDSVAHEQVRYVG